MLDEIQGYKIKNIEVQPSHIKIYVEDGVFIEASLSRNDYDDWSLEVTVGGIDGEITIDEHLSNLQKGQTVKNYATDEIGTIESFGDGYLVYVRVREFVKGMNAAKLSTP